MAVLGELLTTLTILALFIAHAHGKPALSPDVAAGRLGFPVDNHTVKTTDGYFLETFRYMGGQNSEPTPNPAANKPTVLLMPGLGANAEVWFPEYADSLPSQLANAGFEVWLGNYRGSVFGRRHENYSISSREFWQFGWNENALYDIGDTVKYILQTTKQETIQYVSHSYGSTLFVVLNALTKEFQRSFSHGYLLAPPIYLKYITSGLATAKPFTPLLTWIDRILFHDQIPGQELKLPQIFEALCRALPLVCALEYDFTLGKSDLNKTKMVEIFARFPDDFSLDQVLQYGQQVVWKDHTFNQLDYGRSKNLKKYGSKSPPAYNISNILNPLSLYVGRTDAIATLKDVEDLCPVLPNIRRLYVAPHETFGHGDFLVGRNAPKFYETLLQHMWKDASYPLLQPPYLECVCNTTAQSDCQK